MVALRFRIDMAMLVLRNFTAESMRLLTAPVKPPLASGPLVQRASYRFYQPCPTLRQLSR